MSELTSEKINEYKDEIEDFIQMYCSGYCNGDTTFEIEKTEADYFEATIKMETYHNQKWEIPVSLNRDGELVIVVCADIDAFLSFDGQGLFIYLFFEATKRISRRDDKLERMEKYGDSRKAKAEGLMKIINDDTLCRKFICNDNYHDEWHCSTCDNMEAGADAHQFRQQAEAKKIMEAK